MFKELRKLQKEDFKEIEKLKIITDDPNFPAVPSSWHDRNDMAQIIPIMRKINEIIDVLNREISKR